MVVLISSSVVRARLWMLFVLLLLFFELGKRQKKTSFRWLVFDSVFTGLGPGAEKMAISAGLEPATLCLEGRCSIRLSYETA